MEFIESRSREMDAMLRASSTVVGNTAVQQQLPRHMRRRAASHNVKRLPLRLRPQAQKEVNYHNFRKFFYLFSNINRVTISSS